MHTLHTLHVSLSLLTLQQEQVKIEEKKNVQEIMEDYKNGVFLSVDVNEIFIS